jgi:hypothetical protein
MVFELKPESMNIDYNDIKVLHSNLAGDTKKSIIKAAVPTVRISSSYLSLAQRNQIASLRHVSDSFLSFRCRDDWQTYYEPVTINDATHIVLANSSATRLSSVLTGLGFSTTIAIQSPFYLTLPTPAGGSGTTWAPGTITYADSTRIATLQNSISSITSPLYVSYTYSGWLVEMSAFSAKSEGGWGDQTQYDIELVGV